MTHPELRNKLRKFRFEAGEMTQQALAERVGVSRQTIIAIESGRYAPSLPLAFRLSKVFGAKIEDIFDYTDSDE